MKNSIICVHGRGQEWQIKNTIQRDWCDAILMGVERSHTELLKLSDDQIKLVFYGDRFRPDFDDRKKGIIDIGPDQAFEESLADTLLQEAERRGLAHRASLERTISIEAGSMAEKGLRALAKSPLRLLDKIPGFSGFVLRYLIRDVDRYLHDHDFRAIVMDSVVTELKQQQGRGVILLAHSLGTVVAYDVINTHPEIEIQAFITMGSPLGLQGYIYNALLPAGQPPRFPPTIKGDWSNCYDEDDIVAIVPDLAPLFPSASGKTIKTIQIDNRPTNPHADTDYLSSRAVGLAIRSALQALQQ